MWQIVYNQNIRQMTEQNNVHQLVNSITAAVNEDFDDCEIIKKIATRFNTKPSGIVLPVFGVVLFISILSSNLAHILITLFALLYPAYMTFKAIHLNNDQFRKKWLSYWIVFGFATTFDGLLSTILFFLPAFYPFKLLFFVWLFYPRTDGASMIYEKVFKPNLAQFKENFKNLQIKK